MATQADAMLARLRQASGISSQAFGNLSSRAIEQHMAAYQTPKYRGRTVVAGIEELKWNLSFVHGQVISASADASQMCAEKLYARSIEMCPFRHGVLVDSAHVGPDTDEMGKTIRYIGRAKIRLPNGRSFNALRDSSHWRVWYDAAHAWRLHENPDGYTIIPNPGASPEGRMPPPGGPKQDHFLSTPRNEMLGEFPRIVRSMTMRAIAEARMFMKATRKGTLVSAVGAPPRLVKRTV